MARLKSFITFLFKKNIFMCSAQTSFYFLLSLFPFIFIIIKLFNLFSIPIENFISGLRLLFPAVTIDVIFGNLQTITSDYSLLSNIIYTIIAFWSSSMLFYSLKVIFAETYPSKTNDSKISVRIFSLLITAFFFLLIVFMFFASALLNVGLGFLSKLMHIQYFLYAISNITSICLLAISMIIIYVILPPKHIKFSQALPGAIFTTIGLTISSSVFSYYVSNIADYSKIYGALGSVVVLLIWLYICSFVIIGGGYINAYLIKIKPRS